MNFGDASVKAEWDKYLVGLTKAIEHYKSELSTVRAGRANPAILNKVVVDYYGTPTPLPQMANITVPEARLMMISLWDISALRDVVKAITAADLGVNPVDDGKVIRLAFPQLTEERRKDIAKNVKKMAEDCKVVLRGERRDVLEIFKKYKKDNLLTEDDLAQAEKEVQKRLDENIASVDKILKDKEKEIMEV